MAYDQIEGRTVGIIDADMDRWRQRREHCRTPQKLGENVSKEIAREMGVVFAQTFKNIDDILHKDAGRASELDDTEQSSWLLFLKYLDTQEHDKALEARLEGKTYLHSIDAPYRWEAWSAPKTHDDQLDHHAVMTGDESAVFAPGAKEGGSLGPL